MCVQVDAQLPAGLLYNRQRIRIEETVVEVECEGVHPIPVLDRPQGEGGVLPAGEQHHAVVLQSTAAVAVENPPELPLPGLPVYRAVADVMLPAHPADSVHVEGHVRIVSRQDASLVSCLLVTHSGSFLQGRSYHALNHRRFMPYDIYPPGRAALPEILRCFRNPCRDSGNRSSARRRKPRCRPSDHPASRRRCELCSILPGRGWRSRNHWTRPSAAPRDSNTKAEKGPSLPGRSSFVRVPLDRRTSIRSSSDIMSLPLPRSLFFDP